ncbi:hypothetical protein M3J09_002542 [Ascochyta lentis]
MLQSVPVDKEGDKQLIDELKLYLQWNTNTAYLKDLPKWYDNPSLDLFEELDKIKAAIQDDTYQSEWEVQSAITALFAGTGDNHIYWGADINAVMTFGRPVSLVSVSTDGKSAPEVFVYMTSVYCGMGSTTSLPPLSSRSTAKTLQPTYTKLAVKRLTTTPMLGTMLCFQIRQARHSRALFLDILQTASTMVPTPLTPFRTVRLARSRTWLCCKKTSQAWTAERHSFPISVSLVHPQSLHHLQAYHWQPQRQLPHPLLRLQTPRPLATLPLFYCILLMQLAGTTSMAPTTLLC